MRRKRKERWGREYRREKAGLYERGGDGSEEREQRKKQEREGSRTGKRREMKCESKKGNRK